LEETSVLLPDLLDKTQGRLQDFLSAAQSLSLERYATADKLSHLISELSSTSAEDDHDLDGLGGQSKKGQTVLEQLEVLQSELERLEAGLIWAAALEQVMGLRYFIARVMAEILMGNSEQILDPRSHRPSPLATLPRYHALNGLVVDMEATLRRKEPPLPVSPPPLFDDPPRDYDEQFARHHEPITTERMDKRISTLLVTVGSTLFPALTDQVLSSPFLDHLSTQGVQRLVVQYGRADVRLPNGMLPELNGGARFSWKDMIVEVMRFTDDFEGLVKQSDRVISHAGTCRSHIGCDEN